MRQYLVYFPAVEQRPRDLVMRSEHSSPVHWYRSCQMGVNIGGFNYNTRITKASKGGPK